MPESDVVASFQLLINNSQFDRRLSPLSEYFEDTWIGRPSAGGTTRSSTFDIGLWNLYQRSLDHEARTNNAVEGWHNRFQTVGKKLHPTTFQCIEALKAEQKRNEGRVHRLNAGEQLRPQKRVYRDKNERIAAIVYQDERDRVKYLRKIARNFQL